jgi:hypothetical protein
MKANELMIRDWVANPINGKPMKVMSLTRDVELGLSGFYDEVDPVPLTAEILEKIGFVRFYVNYVNYWKMQVDNVYIELRPTEGNMAIWLDYDKDNDGIYANYILPYPDNLHQLQHALRLCGIEKEIIL